MNDDEILKKLLSYGVAEAPDELELRVNKKIEEEVGRTPYSNFLGFAIGWIPFSLSAAGLVFGVFSLAVFFFPSLRPGLDLIGSVISAILSPSVMVVVLSVIALVLVDFLVEKVLSNFRAK
ncbi:MAG: hypothetical protein AB7S54_05665 [Bacteroidales bacterium]